MASFNMKSSHYDLDYEGKVFKAKEYTDFYKVLLLSRNYHTGEDLISIENVDDAEEVYTLELKDFVDLFEVYQE